LHACSDASDGRDISSAPPRFLAEVGSSPSNNKIDEVVQERKGRGESEERRGWLQKQGDKYNKKWQDRLFVLTSYGDDAFLTYYKSTDSDKAKGQVHLNQATSIEEGPPRSIRGVSIPTLQIHSPG